MAFVAGNEDEVERQGDSRDAHVGLCERLTATLQFGPKFGIPERRGLVEREDRDSIGDQTDTLDKIKTPPAQGAEEQLGERYRRCVLLIGRDRCQSSGNAKVRSGAEQR